MRSSAVALVALLPILCAALRGEEYRFQLDNQPLQPLVLYRQDPAILSAGDLIGVRDFVLALGAEKDCRFKMPAEENGTLLLERNGRDDIVAVVIEESRHGGLSNPLEKLSETQLSALWGVQLRYWEESAAPWLKKLRARTAVGIDAWIKTPERVLQALPPQIQYLNVAIREGSGRRPQAVNLQPAEALQQLQYARVDARIDRLDCRTLAQLPRLKQLHITVDSIAFLRSRQTAPLLHPESIGALRSLRTLHLKNVYQCADLSFLQGCAELTELKLSRTSIADLTLLTALPRIKTVHVQYHSLDALPAATIPTLIELILLSTDVPAAALAEFKRLNPQCRVVTRWEELLAAQVQGADALDVTEQSMLERNPAAREALTGAALTQLLEKLTVDDSRGGGHCMCPGDVVLDFRKADGTLAQVTVHHGQALRWSGWDEDVHLNEASITALGAWLAQRGLKHAGNTELAAWREADRAGWPDYAPHLSARVLKHIRRQLSSSDSLMVFEWAAPLEQRAATCFKLLGSGVRSWNSYAGLDWVTRDALERLPAEQLSAGMLAASGTRDGARGCARWLALVGKDSVSKLDLQALAETLPGIIRAGLTDGRELNRRLTLAAVRRLNRRDLAPVVREFFNGALKPEDLPAATTSEPAVAQSKLDNVLEFDPQASERACAALLLALLDDRTMTPAIAKFAATATAADKATVAKALELLAKPEQKKDDF